VVAESFGNRDAERLAAARAPVAQRLNIVIDAVVLHQPLALPSMAGEHGLLCLHGGANVHAEPGLNASAKDVLSFDRVAVVPVRDLLQGGRMAAVSEEIWRGGGKRRGSDQGARHL